MDRIIELRAILKKARNEYYNLTPSISDSEFDALKDELERLNPHDEELASVGATPPKNSPWVKVKHSIPMGSLNKANSVEDMEAWVGKAKDSKYFITHKIDGSSMELVYESGRLVRCVSRGDGHIGEELSQNVSRIPSVPRTISESGTVIVRGEIVMEKGIFQDKYSEEYANPRNTAAGKVRDQKGGGEACLDLRFIGYWMVSDDVQKLTSMDTTMKWLTDQGFEVPTYAVADFEGIKEIFRETSGCRNSIPYEIDGMVISCNNLALLEDLGEKNMRPEGQIAWKFENPLGETRVQDVVWQVGSSNGRITPVAKVDPVLIDGVTITSISLHNLQIFRDLKLSAGCRVIVARRGGIIPYIQANLDLK